MPRFTFHVRLGGTPIIDPEGDEWPDLDTARVAIIAAACAPAEDLRGSRPARNFQIQIADTADQ